MSDKFSLQPNRSICGITLEADKDEQMLMMPVGEFIDLTCPECGAVWRFWTEVVTRQKKIGARKKYETSYK